MVFFEFYQISRSTIKLPTMSSFQYRIASPLVNCCHSNVRAVSRYSVFIILVFTLFYLCLGARMLSGYSESR
jgi:hypothetical protein